MPLTQSMLTLYSVVPETKNLTLEELSEVFRIPTARHARFGLQQAKAFIMWCFRRNPGLQMPVLLKKSPQSRQMDIIYHGTR